MKTIRRITATILIAGMTLSLAACGGSKTSQQNTSAGDAAVDNMDRIEAVAQANGITSLADYPYDESRKTTANSDERYEYVQYAQSMSPTEWQPYNLGDAGKAYGKYLVYEFLFDRVGADDYAPRIAKSYEQPDDTHYVVEIYDNVKDSKGNQITASDVVFSYDLNKNSGYAEYFDLYQSSKAIDDHTVEFELSAPITSLDGFFYLFANVAIVSEKEYDESAFSKMPVGTGPYVLTDFVTDSYVTFEARDDYWQSDDLRSELAGDNVQTIRIDFVSDSSMRMILLENGTSLANPYLESADIDSFLEGGKYFGEYNLTTSYNAQSTTLLANCSDDSIMKDINMRLAVWYAINTSNIVTALGDNANTGCIVDASSAIGDYQDSWNSIESYQTVYDPDLAKEYLEKAGYKGEVVKILAGTFSTKSKTAQVLAEMLRQIGVETEITVVEYVNEEKTLADSKGWDLYTTSQIDNDYTINRIYNCYSWNATWAHGDASKSFIKDQTFEDMINDCHSVEGYDIDKTTAILQYIIDNAYGYGVSFATSYVAWNKVVAKPFNMYGHTEIPMWNCTVFYLD